MKSGWMVNDRQMEKILAYSSASDAPRTMRFGKAAAKYHLASDARSFSRELEAFDPTIVLADVRLDVEMAELLASVQRKGHAVVALVDSRRPGDLQKVLARFNLGPAAGREPSGLLPKLHASNGRLDAQRMAKWFDVSLTRFSKFLGVAVQTVHKTPSGVRLQLKLSVFARIAGALATLFGTEARARIWLNAPNPELGGKTPLMVIEKQKSEVVAGLLEDALVGQPG